MKKLYALIASFALSLAGLAQNSFNITPIPFNPDPFTAGTPSGVTMDDVCSGIIPLPFSFCLNGVSYDSLVIASNGYITFNTAAAFGYAQWPISNPVPYAGYPYPSIFAPWQDIDPSQGGSILYDVRGVAPFRRFIVSYYQVPMFSCSGMLFSEQVILYETTNIIETHIMDKPLCATWNGGAAVHGVMVDSNLAYVVPGRNFPTQWTTANEGYRFEPTGACAGLGPQCFIQGNVYQDQNTDCILDPADPALPNRAVLVNGGAYYGWTDNAGYYSIPVDTGSWTVTQMVPLYYVTACPASGSYAVNLPVQSSTSAGNDFADTVLYHCTDLWVDLGTPNMTRCMGELVGVTYCNQGTETDSNVVVTITLNDSISLDSSSVPLVNIAPNTYTYAAGTLAPGQCGFFQIYAGIGCDSVGTVYCMSAGISGDHSFDCDTTNNEADECHALIASVDPNHKWVASQDFQQYGYVETDAIDNDDVLHYLVQFQNTGNDTAFNITIRDTLSALVDPATLTMGAASAQYSWVIVNDVLIVTFPNILLPDSATNPLLSQGFFKYSIKQDPGHVPGDEIHNSAAIYFDFAAPVITNTTVNYIPLLTQVNPGSTADVRLYPNPGHDLLTVEMADGQPATVIFTNLVGQEVLRSAVDGTTSVNTSALRAGVYLCTLQRDGQTVALTKWVKQ